LNWLLAAVLCVVLVEIAVRLPFAPVMADVSRTGVRSMRVLRSSRISDHWKEKVMLAYSGRMFRASMRLAGILIVLFGIAALIVWGFDAISGGFFHFMLSWQGILATLVLASLYFVARKRIVHA
jgi:hypothetical protein